MEEVEYYILTFTFLSPPGKQNLKSLKTKQNIVLFAWDYFLPLMSLGFPLTAFQVRVGEYSEWWRRNQLHTTHHKPFDLYFQQGDCFYDLSGEWQLYLLNTCLLPPLIILVSWFPEICSHATWRKWCGRVFHFCHRSMVILTSKKHQSCAKPAQ